MAHDKATKAAYAAWYLTPTDERVSRTKWCDDNGVNESTCMRWERQPWFEDALDEARSAGELSADKVNQILKALQEKAAQGDARASGEYRAWLERLKPEDTDDDVSEMDDHELLAMLEAEVEAVKERILESDDHASP